MNARLTCENCQQAFVEHQGILGKRLTKIQAADFFFLAKGLVTHEQRSRAKDRELDLDQFLEACINLADFLNVALIDIAQGKDSKALSAGEGGNSRASSTDKGQKMWKKLFPLHYAASKGDIELFMANWERLKKIQDRQEAQQAGLLRDFPYLAGWKFS